VEAEVLEATYTLVMLVEVELVVALILVTTHHVLVVVAEVNIKTEVPEVPEVELEAVPVTETITKVEVAV
tara:strand:+ start:403 stop:612 length:210 start_codon:yes stop_codon:yes gene_type:complete